MEAAIKSLERWSNQAGGKENDADASCPEKPKDGLLKNSKFWGKLGKLTKKTLDVSTRKEAIKGLDVAHGKLLFQLRALKVRLYLLSFSLAH